jgi:hypothetical protein
MRNIRAADAGFHPAASVFCGLADDGLPIGLQIGTNFTPSNDGIGESFER